MNGNVKIGELSDKLVEYLFRGICPLTRCLLEDKTRQPLSKKIIHCQCKSYCFIIVTVEPRIQLEFDGVHFHFFVIFSCFVSCYFLRPFERVSNEVCQILRTQSQIIAVCMGGRLSALYDKFCGVFVSLVVTTITSFIS